MKPIIPKEHGGWAVLYVPMIVSAAIAGGLTLNVGLLALSALGMFMSYTPVHMLLRHAFVMPLQKDRLNNAMLWSGVYLVFGIAFMVPLLVQGYWLLPVLGFPGAVAFFGNFVLTRRVSKSLPSDMVAVFGLSLSGLCSYYVVTGQVTVEAVIVWLLNVLFFWCSVFYVHMKIRAAARKESPLGVTDRLALGALNILYHVVVIGIVVGLALYRMTTLYVVLAFVPMFVHALYGTYKLSRRVTFHRLGFLLLAQSIVFGLLLWVVWE